jgi:hypothetical protein
MSDLDRMGCDGHAFLRNQLENNEPVIPQPTPKVGRFLKRQGITIGERHSIHERMVHITLPARWTLSIDKDEPGAVYVENSRKRRIATLFYYKLPDGTISGRAQLTPSIWSLRYMPIVIGFFLSCCIFAWIDFQNDIPLEEIIAVRGGFFIFMTTLAILVCEVFRRTKRREEKS